MDKVTGRVGSATVDEATESAQRSVGTAQGYISADEAAREGAGTAAADEATGRPQSASALWTWPPGRPWRTTLPPTAVAMVVANEAVAKGASMADEAVAEGASPADKAVAEDASPVDEAVARTLPDCPPWTWPWPLAEVRQTAEFVPLCPVGLDRPARGACHGRLTSGWFCYHTPKTESVPYSRHLLTGNYSARSYAITS